MHVFTAFQLAVKESAVFGLLVLLLSSQVSLANEPFTFVVLPDTQNYTEIPSNRPYFSSQTQWIRDHIETDGNPRNIQFVSHSGDIVNYGGSANQWDVASDAMGILDGVVKYAVLPGNHDFSTVSEKSAGTSQYLDHFGPARFQDHEWYGGTDSTGNNSFQRFSAGGFDFLHLALEWRPAEVIPYRATSPIEWAQSIIDANPNLPVILSTHEYLVDDPGYRSSTGELIWDQLVRANDQIFMVLGGHHQSGQGFDDGEFHQVSYNDHGRPVLELVQNFQDYPNGGDGWLRLFNFDIPNNQIAVETYSPTLDQFQTETISQVGQHASQFELSVPFDERLAPIVNSAPPDFSFTRSVAFGGTLDKELRSTGDDSSIGSNSIINIGNNGIGQSQALIRFDEFIGQAAQQISPLQQVTSARLVLKLASGGGELSLHEILADWDHASTWQAFGNGLQADGIEAVAEPVDVASTDQVNQALVTGRLEFDVTSSIQAFLAGDRENLGWVLLADSPDGEAARFYSSDFFSSSFRPVLEVYLAGPADGDFNVDHTVAGSDFLAWQLGQSPMPQSISDLVEWRAVHGGLETSALQSPLVVVPEPSVWLLVTLAVSILACTRSE